MGITSANLRIMTPVYMHRRGRQPGALLEEMNAIDHRPKGPASVAAQALGLRDQGFMGTGQTAEKRRAEPGLAHPGEVGTQYDTRPEGRRGRQPL